MTRRRLKLLARYFASECNERERRDIEKRFNSTRESREEFDEIREIWSLSGGQKGNWNSWRAIPSLRKKLREAARETDDADHERVLLYKIIPERRMNDGFSFGRIARIAAVLILLTGTVYMAGYLKEVARHSSALNQGRAAVYENLSTKPGQRVTISFENGTKVLLNSASSLRYAVDRDGTRRFYLTGEAYFEVVDTHRRPLIIHTDNAVIRDIGTKFNVEAWPGDDLTQVTVTEGEVFLRPSGQQAGPPATVLHGQYSIVKGERIIVPPSLTDVADRIAWVRGFLIFHDEPIKTVFTSLQRKYGIQCYVSDSSILRRTLTATFTDHQTPQEIVKIIALSLKLSYKASKDSVLFSRKEPFMSQ